MAIKQDNDEIHKRLDALLDAEGEKLVKDVLWAYYQKSTLKKLSDESRGGLGLVKTPLQIDSEARHEAAKAMQPIESMLRIGVQLTFGRILVRILNDHVLRDMWVQDNARIVGKRGGRPRAVEAPHIQWLRERLEFQDREDPRPTAKEHFYKLKSHPDVEEADINYVSLMEDVLERYGYTWRADREEPRITLNTVTALLTKIRRGE